MFSFELKHANLEEVLPAGRLDRRLSRGRHASTAFIGLRTCEFNQFNLHCVAELLYNLVVHFEPKRGDNMLHPCCKKKSAPQPLLSWFAGTDPEVHISADGGAGSVSPSGCCPGSIGQFQMSHVPFFVCKSETYGHRRNSCERASLCYD